MHSESVDAIGMANREEEVKILLRQTISARRNLDREMDVVIEKAWKAVDLAQANTTAAEPLRESGLKNYYLMALEDMADAQATLEAAQRAVARRLTQSVPRMYIANAVRSSRTKVSRWIDADEDQVLQDEARWDLDEEDSDDDELRWGSDEEQEDYSEEEKGR